MLRKIRGSPLAFGPFELGKLGILINLFSLVYLFFVIIWMPFPTVLPVTGTNMNYAGPILLAVIIGGVADWFISGRKAF
jgi:choline transport protein